MRTIEEELAIWDTDLAKARRRLNELKSERDRLSYQVAQQERLVNQMEMARPADPAVPSVPSVSAGTPPVPTKPTGDTTEIADAVRAAG